MISETPPPSTDNRPTPGNGAADLRVLWLDSWTKVDALGLAYDRLLRRCGDEAFFYLRERLALLWPAHQRLGGELVWLWVERQGEGVALIPLQLEKKDILRGGVRRLGSYGKVRGALAQWYSEWLIPDPADYEGVFEAIRQALGGPYAGRWDLMELDYLQVTHPITKALAAGWPGIELEHDKARYTSIMLDGDFTKYAEKFPGKFQREILREERKLNSLAARVEFDRTTTVSPERWAQLEQVHQSRQRQITSRGDERVPLFESTLRGPIFRQMIEWANATGLGRHYWLLADDELIAFMLGTAYGETLFLQLTAMSERYARVSPTRLLMWRLLQQEAELHQTRRIELGLGMNLFKHQFGTHFPATCRITWVNPASPFSGLRCRWLNTARKLRSRVDQARNPEAGR